MSQVRPELPQGRRMTLFAANITSFSSAAQKYLFSQTSNILMIVEHHKAAEDIVDACSKNGWRASASDPEPTATSTGSHGGEFVASKNFLNCKPLDTTILQSIQSATNAPLRLAASRLYLNKGITVILVSVYLWHTEGLFQRNKSILNQINTLRLLTNLPIICYCDFNMKPGVIEESGWLDTLCMSLVRPDAQSTLKTASDSLIDYF